MPANPRWRGRPAAHGYCPRTRRSACVSGPARGPGSGRCCCGGTETMISAFSALNRSRAAGRRQAGSAIRDGPGSSRASALRAAACGCRHPLLEAGHCRVIGLRNVRRLQHLDLAHRQHDPGDQRRRHGASRAVSARRARENPEGVGRFLRRTERQSLRLEVGVLDGQIEDATVERAILVESAAEFVQQPQLVGVAEVLKDRRQRVDSSPDGLRSPDAASCADALAPSSVPAITARFEASAALVN